MIYHDTNGRVIESGMFIKHVDEQNVEEVFPCGDNDLGLLASNPDYLKNHPEACEEYYPLYQFNLDEWEIVNAVGG